MFLIKVTLISSFLLLTARGFSPFPRPQKQVTIPKTESTIPSIRILTPTRLNATPKVRSGTKRIGLRTSNTNNSNSRFDFRSQQQDNNGQPISKRQERVARLVQTELARILHTGDKIVTGTGGFLEEDLRRRISVVSANVSPDLRQARIAVSIQTNRISTNDGNDDGNDDKEDNDAVHNDPVLEKRRAYSWLVQNTKLIRHALAQKMSHMKVCPNLTFAQVDVGAAVDVMYLIDKVSAGAKRENFRDMMWMDGKNLDSMELFDLEEDDEDDDDLDWVVEETNDKTSDKDNIF